MAVQVWGAELARRYEAASAEMFAPEVLGPCVEVLAGLAGGGAALEFAIGTGRVALPLSARGVPVSGIELSPHMARLLAAKPGAEAIALTIGDMTSARAAGQFSLVYLVYNAIENVTAQDEQVAVFRNAAAHLVPGGRFVVEVSVPAISGLPRAERGRVFDLSPQHVGIDSHDDPVGQILTSHHWTLVDGQWVRDSEEFRYVWPSELDLMGRLAGFRLEHRWSGWDRLPFTARSDSHVSVYRKEPLAQGLRLTPP